MSIAGWKGIQRGQAKYLRINEQVPRPWNARRFWDGDEYDQQHAVISKDASLGLKVQLGIVPIEPDGSAYFLVPADRNIYFQVLDENFMELQRERTYVNYRPGERRSCIGCHETPSQAPLQHAKALAGSGPAALRSPARNREKSRARARCTTRPTSSRSGTSTASSATVAPSPRASLT